MPFDSFWFLMTASDTFEWILITFDLTFFDVLWYLLTSFVVVWRHLRSYDVVWRRLMSFDVYWCLLMPLMFPKFIQISDMVPNWKLQVFLGEQTLCLCCRLGFFLRWHLWCFACTNTGCLSENTALFFSALLWKTEQVCLLSDKRERRRLIIVNWKWWIWNSQ